MSGRTRKEEERELLQRACEAQERQARALEAIAGILMVDFDYDEDRPDYTVEALYEEALFHGRGGDLP